VPEVASRYEVGELIASKGAGRVNIWKAGMALIARSPLLGHGLWTFGPLYAQNDMPSPRSGVVGGTYPHNDLLGVTVNLGIVGALLYLVLVGRAVARPLRVRSDAGSPQRRTLALLTAGLLVYWVAGGLTSDILHTKTFWLLLGLSYAAGRVPKAQYGGTWGQTDDGHLFRTAEETVESSRRRNRPVRPERGTDTE
jgi:O-antigen ligase